MKTISYPEITKFFYEKFRSRNSIVISPDDIAIVGLNGYLFLYKGFNRYYDMYFDSRRLVNKVISTWETTLKNWNEVVTVKGGKFVFILVPNKATMLNEFYPLRLPAKGTPYMSKLKKFSDVRVFSPKLKEDIFRKNDTHLSPTGNVELFNFILFSLGINIQYKGLAFAGTDEINGDLGSKFDPPISELVKFYSLTDDFSKPQIVSDNSSEYLPSRHVGISIRLSNAKAPVTKTLRVFGNSFLGVATEYSTLWLLGTVFQNVVFEWSPRVNLDAIEENEIVIFQTCERFLGYPPDHWG